MILNQNQADYLNEVDHRNDIEIGDEIEINRWPEDIQKQLNLMVEINTVVLVSL